jgi:hypothetical protein
MENTLSLLLSDLRACDLPNCEDRVFLMSQAVSRLISLSASLKTTTLQNRNVKLHPAVNAVYEEGIGLADAIRGCRKNRETLKSTIEKMRALVKPWVSSPQPLSQILEVQADRQHLFIVPLDWCKGLFGFQAMASHRPHLMDYPSCRQCLPHIARILKTLMSCFAEVGFNSRKKEEGEYLLQELAKVADTYQGTLNELYEPGTPTARIVASLLYLKAYPELNESTFESIRDTLIGICYDQGITPASSHGVTEAHVIQLFETEAGIAAEELPEHLQPDHAATGQNLAKAFQSHQPHHGALLFGGYGVEATTHQEQLWGDGGGIPTSVFLNAANPQNVSSKAAKAIKELMNRLTRSFYEDLSLFPFEYELVNDVLIPEPIENEGRIALVTVNAMADYEVEAEIVRKGYLFGLDENQKSKIKLKKIVEVVLFGLQNDMFSAAQIISLLLHYPVLKTDSVGRALAQAVPRLQEAVRRGEEVSRFPSFAIELERLMQLPNFEEDEE